VARGAARRRARPRAAARRPRAGPDGAGTRRARGRMTRAARSGPLALVMGDIDLVRPLALAGIRSALFSPPRTSARLSRSVCARLPWHDHWREPEVAAKAIAGFAAGLPERPVLMPQSDGDLLVAHRWRDELGAACALLLAAPETVEALIDKERFARLAERLGLPTPRSCRIDARLTRPDDLDLAFPLVVKPLLRDSARWRRVEPAAKALYVPDAAALRALWPALEASGDGFLAQEGVAGPETAIESFHAYVDERGALAAAFTGRKIRTWPAVYGHSTAVEVTDIPDVAAAGRDVLERLELRGVAKVDFKRGPGGRLSLLEVNPRFTLWHHPAALAGVNIPALVYADLTGRPRPPVRREPGRVRWCLPHADLRAARAEGVPLASWLAFLRGCRARSGLALDDPLPFLLGVGWPRAARLVGRD